MPITRGLGNFLGLAAAAGLVFLSLGAPASAEMADPYRIVGLKADDAVAAKNAAISQGIGLSVERLFRRLATESAWNTVKHDPKALADRLMVSFQIVGEQISPRGYQAILNVQFDELLVKEFCSSRGIRITDDPAPPVLILPVMVEDGIPTYWEDAAPFAEVLGGIDQSMSLTPIKLPTNSLEDRMIRTEHLLTLDQITMDSLRVLDVISDRWKQVAADHLSAMPVHAMFARLEGGWPRMRESLEATGLVRAIAVEYVGERAAEIRLFHEAEPRQLLSRLAELRIDLFRAGGRRILQPY